MDVNLICGKKWDCKAFLKICNASIDKDFEKIRIVKNVTYSMDGRITRNFAYLTLKDRVIVSADYGFGKLKGIKLEKCEECWNNNPELRMKNIFTGEDC